MSVIAYAGNTGSGKTSNVVEYQILPALKAGRTVYHNLTLYEDKIRELIGEFPGKLVYFDRENTTAAELVANAPAGALVVIDESWRYWRAGIKSTNVPDVEFKFFAMHRHSIGAPYKTNEKGEQVGTEMDIVIVAQDLGTGVAMFIRALVKLTYLSVELQGVGIKDRYRIEIYNGPVTGQEPPKSKQLRSMMAKRNPAIFACYQSHTMSETGAVGANLAADKRATLWKSWPILAAAFAFPVLGLAIWNVWGFGGLKPKQAQRAPERSDGARSPGVVSAPAPPVAPAPALALQESKEWRLVGRYYQKTKRNLGNRSSYAVVNYFLVQSVGGVIRVAPDSCHVDNIGNWTCVFRGQLVADWTGPAPPAVNKMLAGTLSGNADSIKVERAE